jgi:gelsolin
MLKDQQIKLEDSNIANYGSKEHKDVKVAAAKTEEAWKGAGQKVGVEIWRIEKFHVVPWPKEKYGSFFMGDSYIILNTYKNPGSDALKYNVHFWLGKDTSQDEMGTAAYKTVELDDLLGDLPVQYREVQGHESEEFLSIFKGKISILAGGVDSGFNHVKPTEYKPRLMHFKGNKENIRVTEVALAWKSLNDGDVFLLDNGLELIVWNGKTAGIYEKRKAQEITNALREERNGKPTVKILDGLEDHEHFWKILGGKPSAGQIAPATSDDVKVENPKALYQLSDATGDLKLTEVSKGSAKKSSLKSEDVFILDAGHTVFSWIGKGTTKKEKANAIKYATDYLKKQGRPSHTPVVRVLEGAEPAAFFKNFD